MVASTRSPVKPLVASVGLSLSFALIGCAGNQLSSSQVVPIPETPSSQAIQNQVVEQVIENQVVKNDSLKVSDWTSDRILDSRSFSTQAFSDAIKPNLTCLLYTSPSPRD